MGNIVNKLVLAALCSSIQLFLSTEWTAPVVTMLVAIILTATNYYVDKKNVSLVICCGAMLLSVYFHPLAYFTALFVHDLTAAEKKHFSLLALAPIISLILEQSYFPAAFSTAFCLIAFWLAIRELRLSRVESELIRIRDTDAEMAIQLSSQNQRLIDNQNNEIYLATLRERNRISREIHDNVGHLLSRSLLQVGALLAITDGEKLPVQKAQLQSLKDTLDSAMDSTRKSVHNMHDESIDIKSSVKEILDAVADRYTIETEFDLQSKPSAKVSLCFISTVKEAVSNTVKHSNATKISVTMREHPAFYNLTVSDNGTASFKSSSDGMGISNMRERVGELGGIFRVENTNGYRIFISIRKDN